jgi:hypothetical protein
MSVVEIAQQLALPKTTVYYWIRDLPLGRPRRDSNTNACRAMQAKHGRLRNEAYAQGLAEYEQLSRLPTFRDFVVLYIAEGAKRNRNRVAIGNSDPRMVALAAGWLERLTPKRMTYSIQFHADQSLEKLRQFWSELLKIEPTQIVFQRKSNSGQLNGRRWRSVYGVLSVTVSDTYLRSRLQAWIDRIRAEWELDSATRHGA